MSCFVSRALQRSQRYLLEAVSFTGAAAEASLQLAFRVREVGEQDGKSLPLLPTVSLGEVAQTDIKKTKL